MCRNFLHIFSGIPVFFIYLYDHGNYRFVQLHVHESTADSKKWTVSSFKQIGMSLMYCMAWIWMYQYVEWPVGVHNKAINGVLVHCLDMVGTNVHKGK